MAQMFGGYSDLLGGRPLALLDGELAGGGVQVQVVVSHVVKEVVVIVLVGLLLILRTLMMRH